MKSQSAVSGIAVLGHPRGAGQQVAVALHVQQRHLHHDRAEQLRVLRQHVADQQAAVAAALDAQVLRRGDLARDQVLRRPRRSPRRPCGGSPSARPGASAGRTRRRRGCWPPRTRRPSPASPCRRRRNSPASARSRSRRSRTAGSARCRRASGPSGAPGSTAPWCRPSRWRSAARPRASRRRRTPAWSSASRACLPTSASDSVVGVR